jgi:DNA-binding NtrC family response regulator
MENPIILVAVEDKNIRDKLNINLTGKKFRIFEVLDQMQIMTSFYSQSPDLVIIGSSRKAAWNAFDIARQLRQKSRNVPLILITEHSSEAKAIGALRAGFNDYFKRPVSWKDLLESIYRNISDYLRRPLTTHDTERRMTTVGPQHMVGESPALREVKMYLQKVAATDCTVLITGETGTGKELAAGIIHSKSARYQKPFVCINCASLPENLLESELFGYERGAFTGAYSVNAGKLKFSDGGTVFFDEIGEMSQHAQAKILRVIENKRFSRLGGKRSIPVDIRIITATNLDPECLVADGKFRKDLYYRLNVARIHMPPLRERKEDIPSLLDYYTQEFNQQFGRQVEGCSEEVVASLCCYDWPGNVRELKNLLEATFINLISQKIAFIDLPRRFQKKLKEAQSLPINERDQLLSALFATNWNKSKAAQKLHWSRMTLYRKMAKHHIVTRQQA